MGAQVTIERGEGDRLVAVKRPRPGAEQALVAEAAVLRTVRMPGVVEMVDDAETADPAVLVTRWVGPRTVADLDRPLSPERAAGLCLAVAATVSRLHRAGVVHGAIEASHVLLDPGGRPVLCGFGSAGPIGATTRPADDVAGLGRLLIDLLASEGETSGQPAGPAPRRADRTRRRALLAAAAQACTDDPSNRPSVAAFVHGVRRAVPDARLALEEPARSDGRASGPEESPRRAGRPTTHSIRGSRSVRQGAGPRRSGSPTQAWIGVAAVIVAGATAYFGLTAWGSSADPVPGDVPASPIAATSTAPTTRASRTTAPSTSSVSSTTSSTSVPSPTTPTGAGPLVEHLGRRYEVGQAGDVAAVGPWFCDGNDVVAVLRPSSGTVHVFTTWASADGTVDARTVTSVPGASTLQRVTDGPGCAVLVVGTSTGPLRTLTAEDLR